MKKYICKTCGGDLLPHESGGWRCPYCASIWFDETVKHDEEEILRIVGNYNEAQKIELIANIRRNLYNAINEKYTDSQKIVSLCARLKEYLPDDFMANFYEAANSAEKAHVAALIDRIDPDIYYEYIDGILKFLIKSFALEYHLPLVNLIERAYRERDLEKFERYSTALAEEAVKENNGVYQTSLSRDVFIAYSSKDMNKVQTLVSYLEASGLTCFVAARNLRHGRGAVQNYKGAIEEAILNCRAVVFVSSPSSRSFSCDALSFELPKIKQHDIQNAPAEYRQDYKKMPSKYKKLRVEYRTGESLFPNAADIQVKEFFDGCEFAYTPEEVAGRIFSLFTAFEEEKEEKKPPKYCVGCGKEVDASAKRCPHCQKSEFVETRAEYENILLRRQLDEQRRMLEELKNATKQPVKEEPKAEPKYCASCGKQNSANAKSCIYCGHSEFVPTRADYNNIVLQRQMDEQRRLLEKIQNENKNPKPVYTPSAPPAKKYCTACGSENSASSSTCQKCGGKGFVQDKAAYDSYIKKKEEALRAEAAAKRKAESAALTAIRQKQGELHLSKAGDMLSAGFLHAAVATSGGKAFACGENEEKACNVANWDGIVALSAGSFHTLGLKADGTVVAAGTNKAISSSGQTYVSSHCDVSSWKNIVGVSAGYYYSLGLTSDGNVVIAGNKPDIKNSVEKWSDICEISAGMYNALGLKIDGSVVCTRGQYTFDLSSWKNITQISAGVFHHFGLKEDGTVLEAITGNFKPFGVEAWKDIVYISSSETHVVGIKADGTAVYASESKIYHPKIGSWKNLVAVAAGTDFTLGLTADGTVLCDSYHSFINFKDYKLFSNIKALPDDRKKILSYLKGNSTSTINKKTEVAKKPVSSPKAEINDKKAPVAAASNTPKQYSHEELFGIGYDYLFGQNGKATDRKKAESYFKDAIDKGSNDAYYWMGWIEEHNAMSEFYTDSILFNYSQAAEYSKKYKSEATEGVARMKERQKKKTIENFIVYTKLSDGTYEAKGGFLDPKYFEGHLVIPSNYNGKPVTAIADKAFFDNKQLLRITLPTSIKSIGYSAFYKCSILKEIIFEGTKKEWKKVKKDVGWCLFTFSTPLIVTCTDGIVKER